MKTKVDSQPEAYIYTANENAIPNYSIVAEWLFVAFVLAYH